MVAQSMALAVLDVFTTPGGDLRTISFPVVGERILPLSSLCIVEGNKGVGARELGTSSSVNYTYQTPGSWESD